GDRISFHYVQIHRLLAGRNVTHIDRAKTILHQKPSGNRSSFVGMWRHHQSKRISRADRKPYNMDRESSSVAPNTTSTQPKGRQAQARVSFPSSAAEDRSVGIGLFPNHKRQIVCPCLAFSLLFLC